MATITQMQVRFEPGEDRLMFRVRSDDGSELRFWLTRRYLRLAWPLLRERLDDAPLALGGSVEARREIASFEHESALESADFDTPFEHEATALPLGDAPVLLTRFSLRDRGEAGVVVSLHPARGHGIELALSRPLLHSFCKLVSDAARAAEWELASMLPDPRTPPAAGVAH